MKNRKQVSILIFIIVAFCTIVPAFADSGYELNQLVFDIEELSLFDVWVHGLNGALNTVFSITKTVAKTTIDIFSVAYNSNIFELFGSEFLSGVQRTLKDIIFDNLAILMIVFGFVFLLGSFYRGNYTAVFAQLVRSVAIVAAAGFLTINTSEIVSMISQITRDTSTGIIAGVYNTGRADNADIVDDIESIIQKNLIETPFFEIAKEGASNHVSNEEIEDIITDTDRETRQETINELAEKKDALSKNTIGARLGAAVLFLMVMPFKCMLFLAIGAVQMVFQITTVIIVLLASFVLVLSLVPQLGGTMLIATWLKKILELQINIVLINFIMAIVLKIDAWCYGIPGLSWMGVILLQIIIIALMIGFRHKIFGIFEAVGSGVQSGGGAINRAINHMPTGARALSSGIDRIIPSQQIAMQMQNTKRQLAVASATAGNAVRSGAGQVVSLAVSPIAQPVSMVADYADRRISTLKSNLEYDHEKKEIERERQLAAQRKKRQSEMDSRLDTVVRSVSPSLSREMTIDHRRTDTANQIKRERQIAKAIAARENGSSVESRESAAHYSSVSTVGATATPTYNNIVDFKDVLATKNRSNAAVSAKSYQPSQEEVREVRPNIRILTTASVPIGGAQITQRPSLSDIQIKTQQEQNTRKDEAASVSRSYTAAERKQIAEQRNRARKQTAQSRRPTGVSKNSKMTGG